MPKILVNYAVNKYIPEEGSEEWLALLPNWSGWYYALGHDNGPYYFMVHDWGYSGVGWQWPQAEGGKDFYYKGPSESALPTIGGRPYITGEDDSGTLWYYFRGSLVDTFSTYRNYRVGRATSLTPQI